ncbi:protein PLANT CADMIUM RESISTANCE 10 isoform X2 [Vigna angularis]|uniref:protein PLANT CADMIUM RESISTANCE 10 isoform X2 n=2 Tax=Phaseolus angularis TaxID=3914 RepID=UPI000809B942|nr:protein PLANT CADMIUM RESISTANCE 10 isoform X2 [Vigna angularis]
MNIFSIHTSCYLMYTNDNHRIKQNAPTFRIGERSFRCEEELVGCIGCLCPCFLFGKNAEILGSGTFLGSCVTHFILWSVVNTACCLLTDGLFLGLPGCLVSCYACGYRKALRSKYNLPEAPCGDFVTHFCCHPCAICQEYREICERSGDSQSTNLKLAVVTAPPIQTMQPDSKQ